LHEEACLNLPQRCRHGHRLDRSAEVTYPTVQQRSQQLAQTPVSLQQQIVLDEFAARLGDVTHREELKIYSGLARDGRE